MGPVTANIPATVRHELLVRHAARPKPTLLYIQYENADGQLFQTSPVSIIGQAIAPITIPISRITGRNEDNSKPDLVFRLRLEYEQVEWYNR